MIKYIPSPPPTGTSEKSEIIRAVWDDLFRISTAMEMGDSSGFNLDGGQPDSVYGPNQFIDGGTL